MDITIKEIMTCVGSIIATSFTFSKMFFSRLNKLENSFGESIEKLNDQLQNMDKNLAVNSAIIEQFMKGRL